MPSTLTITFDDNDNATDITMAFQEQEPVSLNPDFVLPEVTALLIKIGDVFESFQEPK